MSGELEPADLQPKEDPETLVLRGRPRPVVRFRRGLIIGITGSVAAVLITLSWIALEPRGRPQLASAGEKMEPGLARAPDALAGAPRNYGEVPRLGPPLPGDLGGPILDHQRSVEATTPRGTVSRDRDAQMLASKREGIAAEKAATRSSPLIAQLAEPARQSEGTAASLAPTAEPTPEQAAGRQQHKMEFVRASEGSVDPHMVRAPASPSMLAAGTVIPASLITGLNSDLPGMVLAQVTENVRDSMTGRTILVPQGARLMGRYDSVVAYGQKRALLVWTRILFPDGSSIEVDHLPATDVSGYSGVADEVDSHTWKLLKGVALSTLFGVGTQLSLGASEGDLVRAIRESAQQNAANVGGQITSRNLDVQPTITVRPGWPVRAILNKDLVIQPWRS